MSGTIRIPYTYDESIAERDRFRGANRDAIPVVDEELQVGKRAVQRGGGRVHSRVVEQPVEQAVDLREENMRDGRYLEIALRDFAFTTIQPTTGTRSAYLHDRRPRSAALCSGIRPAG